MARRRALLAAGAAASAAYQAASSQTLLLPRATRAAGSSFVATPTPSSSIAPRRTIATLATRAGLSTLTRTRVRMFSASRRQNRETLRWYRLQVFEKVKAIIAKNHSAAMLAIEKNRGDLSLDLHKAFHDKIWKWFGAVSALCSASISVSYYLNDHRVSTSEVNVSKRVEAQDREIKLLWLQLDRQKDNLTSNEVLFETVRAEQVAKGSHVLINDSPCMVHNMEQYSVGDKEMTKLVCRDIFNGQHMELVLPNNYLLKVPYVRVKEYFLVNTNPDGLYVTVREQMEQKEFRASPATIGALTALQGKKVFVTVTSAMGKDAITSVREVPEGQSVWAWALRFFNG